jgi:hypothetical protein
MQRQKLTDFPEKTANYLKANMPPSYELWWIRGVIVNVEVGVPTAGAAAGNEFTKLTIADLDREMPRIVHLKGKPGTNDFYPNDPVSVFGHRPKGTDGPKPRYIINHNTSYHRQAYYDIVKEDGILPFSAKETLDNWLRARVPVGAAQKAFVNLLCAVAVLALPLYLLWSGALSKMFGFFTSTRDGGPVAAIILLAVLVWAGGFCLDMAKSFYDDWVHKYVDLSKIYETVAIQIYQYVKSDRASQQGMMIEYRGPNTSGLSKD